ncbi:MAG TPA: PepSY domain-containing protein [Gammaproteobacteria bacterium]
MPAPKATWVDRPQSSRLRRALFQVHLWTGIVLGVYVVVISVSGSVAVFRREVNFALIPRTVETVGETRLDRSALEAALAPRYPGYRLVRISEPRRPERPVQVALERDGIEISRLVDPYTGRDLGSPFPAGVRVMEWIVRLHDDLLAGETGRKLNGAAGVLCTALVLTGAVIWWPGRRRWRYALTMRRGRGAPRLSWQLHSVLGFWCFALLLGWAVTGVYFAFPQPFEAVMDGLDSDPSDLSRPGEGLLLALIKLHFGRFGGLGIRFTWALLGLVPAVLFVTGFTMWWRRVVRRRWLRDRTAPGSAIRAPAS